MLGYLGKVYCYLGKLLKQASQIFTQRVIWGDNPCNKLKSYIQIKLVQNKISNLRFHSICLMLIFAFLFILF